MWFCYGVHHPLSLVVVLLPILLCLLLLPTIETTTSTVVRRERNLDFLDVDTLAYYLGVDPTTGKKYEDTTQRKQQSEHDGPAVAVMLYSRWDMNSHNFAPLWDAIATLLDAGKHESDLIMGLFDCEADARSSEFCKTIRTSNRRRGKTAAAMAYPTMIYIPPGSSNNKKKRELPKLFPGDWRFGASVYDWIRAMQAVSGWDRFWSKKKKKGGSGDLPIGMPSRSNNIDGSSGRSSASLREENKQLNEVVTKASVLVDSLLFPIKTTDHHSQEQQYSDVFSMLKHHWVGNDGPVVDYAGEILKTCAMDIGLDYCERVSLHAAKDDYERLFLAANNDTMEDMEDLLAAIIEEREPYCAIIENCILSHYVESSCRPEACPFRDEAACRYLTSCLSDSVQEQYARVLGIDLDAIKKPSQQQQQQQQEAIQEETSTSTTTSSGNPTTTTKRKGRGWLG